MDLILLVGFKNSGKDTAANFLINEKDYIKFSFADSLKNLIANLFSWDRELLEGTTEESRLWRETKDEWWEKKLGIPNFTPRYAMEYIGTDIFRNHFHKDIWILSLERKLKNFKDKSVVVTDGRFPNEIKLIKKMNGKVFQVFRGNLPDYYDIALKANINNDRQAILKLEQMKIHPAEYAWIGQNMNGIIKNTGTLQDLRTDLVKHKLL